jgi:hypothetical protein
MFGQGTLADAAWASKEQGMRQALKSLVDERGDNLVIYQ